MKPNPKEIPRIILASTSTRRSSLLAEYGIPFKVVPPNIKELEAVHDQTSPTALTLENAHRKARAVAKKHPRHWVLGADTLVALDRKVFGKPCHMQHAFEMLQQLCGRTHRVITGVVLLKTGHPAKQFYAVTKVTFKPLNKSQIRAYLKLIDPLDKAGAYAAQTHTRKIIKCIQGSFTNVVGLPMEKLIRLLRTVH